MKGILKRIGYERDWVQEGIRGICLSCDKDFYDEEKACWGHKADMSCDLDVGIKGFTLAHIRCKKCEREI